jgi:hypothetical protein
MAIYGITSGKDLTQALFWPVLFEEPAALALLG